jgi:hypothetical protein
MTKVFGTLIDGAPGLYQLAQPLPSGAASVRLMPWEEGSHFDAPPTARPTKGPPKLVRPSIKYR